MKKNRIIGDRDKRKPIEELLKKAIEDPAFQEAFGEKREEPKEEQPKPAAKKKEIEQGIEEKVSSQKRFSLRFLGDIPSEGDNYSVRAVAFAPDSSHIAVGRSYGTVDLYTFLYVMNKVHLDKIDSKDYPGDVRGVSFSPDNKYLAVGCKDRYLRVHEFGGTAIGKVIAHAKQPSRVNDIAFSPDGNYIIIGGGKQGKRGFFSIYFFNNERLTQYKGIRRKDIVSGVAFNDSHYVIGSKNLKVFHRGTFEKPVEYSLDGWVNAVAFSPDRKLLATGHYQSLGIYGFDAEASGNKILTCITKFDPSVTAILKGNNIHSLSFSPNGKYLAVSGGRNINFGGFVKIFEVK